MRAHAWEYVEAMRVLNRTRAAVKGIAKDMQLFAAWVSVRRTAVG
jgi:hypothetical protein